MKDHQQSLHAGTKDETKPDKPKTQDSNNPRTRDPADQETVWEEEGGSPSEAISSTKTVKPKLEPKAGSMGPAKD